MGIYGDLNQISKKPEPGASPARKRSKASAPARRKRSNTPRNHDTTVACDHHRNLDAIRAEVRRPGKEAATHRFTRAEKDALAEIVYEQRREQIRTSENEITRIAINFIVDDYRAKGAGSILKEVLRRINS